MCFENKQRNILTVAWTHSCYPKSVCLILYEIFSKFSIYRPIFVFTTAPFGVKLCRLDFRGEKMVKNKKKIVKDVAILTLGAFIAAVGDYFFKLPNNPLHFNNFLEFNVLLSIHNSFLTL